MLILSFNLLQCSFVFILRFYFVCYDTCIILSTLYLKMYWLPPDSASQVCNWTLTTHQDRYQPCIKLEMYTQYYTNLMILIICRNNWLIDTACQSHKNFTLEHIALDSLKQVFSTLWSILLIHEHLEFTSGKFGLFC